MQQEYVQVDKHREEYIVYNFNCIFSTANIPMHFVAANNLFVFFECQITH